MAKDAIGFIKALGYHKINVLGFSMGGFIAQQIVLDEPQLIHKLILAGTGSINVSLTVILKQQTTQLQHS